MDEIKKIVKAEQENKQENQLFAKLDSAQLQQLYDYYRVALKNDVNSVLVIFGENISMVLDDVIKTFPVHRNHLVRMFCAAQIGKNIERLKYRSNNSLNGFNSSNLKQISDANIDFYDIADAKKIIYIFEYGNISPLLQKALNDYTKFKDKGVVTKIFTTQDKLSSTDTLDGDVVSAGIDYVNKTSVYCKDEKIK